MASNFFGTSYTHNFAPILIIGGTNNEYPSHHFMVAVYQPTILGYHRIGFFVRYDMISIFPTAQPSANVEAPITVGEGEGFFANYTGFPPTSFFIGGSSPDFPHLHVVIPVYNPTVYVNHQHGSTIIYTLLGVIRGAHTRVHVGSSNWVPAAAGGDAQEHGKDVESNNHSGEYSVNEAQNNLMDID